jgi:hypothetical protein
VDIPVLLCNASRAQGASLGGTWVVVRGLDRLTIGRRVAFFPLTGSSPILRHCSSVRLT